tara:strand:+ start:8930 stop:9427 length:498 start_codon:yes stop_codon:yes gene_type:complete
MASQNLLQRLDKAADTTGSSVDASNRRIEEVFIAAEAIVAGDFVTLDLNQSDDSDKVLYVKKLTATAISNLGIGVALESASIDGNIRICIRGICSANVDSGIAQSDRLVASSTAGRAEKAPEFRTDLGDGTGTTAGTVVQQAHIVAWAVSAESGNVANVYVLPQF